MKSKVGALLQAPVIEQTPQHGSHLSPQATALFRVPVVREDRNLAQWAFWTQPCQGPPPF